MDILVVADIHGDLEKLYKLVDHLEKEKKKPDVVLVAGDLTSFGPASLIKPIKKKLSELSSYVLAVPGNGDTEEVREAMKDFDIHGKEVKLKKTKIVGFEVARWISGEEGIFVSYDPVHKLLKKENKERVVLLTHVPPFDTEVDKVWTGHHVGSPFLRSLIEDYKPDLVVCGHIHEARGMDTIGETLILNPGALAEGYAAWVKLEDEPEITFFEIKKKEVKEKKVEKVKI